MTNMEDLMPNRKEKASERITRITGDIPDNCGVLNIRFDAWFKYENNISMQVLLLADEGAFKENGINWIHSDENGEGKSSMVIALSESEAISEAISYRKELPKSIVKRPYPNPSYISLAGKNGRRHSDIGFPFVSTIDNLNAATHISFTLLGVKPNVFRSFVFPISISMTKEKRFASVHFKDMFYYNQHSPIVSEQILRKLGERARDLSISTPFVLDGFAQKKTWSWCKESETQEYFSEPEHQYGHIHEKWLTPPTIETAALVDEYGEANPYVPVFGLDFSDIDDSETLANNTIYVVGVENPMLLMP